MGADREGRIGPKNPHKTQDLRIGSLDTHKYPKGTSKEGKQRAEKMSSSLDAVTLIPDKKSHLWYAGLEIPWKSIKTKASGSLNIF